MQRKQGPREVGKSISLRKGIIPQKVWIELTHIKVASDEYALTLDPNNAKIYSTATEM